MAFGEATDWEGKIAGGEQRPGKTLHCSRRDDKRYRQSRGPGSILALGTWHLTQATRVFRLER
jgi:hypothetical protein